MKNILITTEHRGVFFAQVEENQDLSGKTIENLKNARMAIYWGTTDGLFQLANTGPTSESRISAPADIPFLHDITAVMLVKDEAAKKVWL